MWTGLNSELELARVEKDLQCGQIGSEVGDPGHDLDVVLGFRLGDHHLHHIDPGETHFLELGLPLDLHLHLQSDALLEHVGVERLGPQPLERVAPAVAIDGPYLGVEALGEGIRRTLVVEVVEDVWPPVAARRLDHAEGLGEFLGNCALPMQIFTPGFLGRPDFVDGVEPFLEVVGGLGHVLIEDIADGLLVDQDLLGDVGIGVFDGLAADPAHQALGHLAAGINLGHSRVEGLFAGPALEARGVVTVAGNVADDRRAPHVDHGVWTVRRTGTPWTA